MTTPTLSTLLQRFFTDRLCTQMEASQNTIAGYRDTFRLLLRFASQLRGKVPTKLQIEDLDAVPGPAATKSLSPLGFAA
jgi:integrase/recombinase XerD